MTTPRTKKGLAASNSSTAALLKKLGLKAENPGVFCGEWLGSGKLLKSTSPVDGRLLASVRTATPQEYERVAQRAQQAFFAWQTVPAPKRGEIVRQLGNALRDAKGDLGRLVTLEMGKMEQWHPLGVVGIVTAFNFPVAVWAWNSALAAVCGDATLWKPSSQTPLTAIATIKIAERICRANQVDPALFSLVIGDGATIGECLIGDPRLPLISATGSTRMGRHVAEVVARRLGRSLLELGGNNAIIVAPTADVDLAMRAILFGAVGTAGQRCTTTRRIIVHESLREVLARRLTDAYRQVPIGSPLEAGTLMGPLVNTRAVEDMQAALAQVRKEHGEILYGGEPLRGPRYPGGCYVRPCLVAARHDMKIVHEEACAPILYLISYRTLEEAIAYHNEVPQGL
ncbi:MAG: aldehyde dehydrogenase family protein, partial [Verrucomicrobia bacterium]|nr:aldehyde dehydrogenase family protein [Verrucomicrobiota bacterium]